MSMKSCRYCFITWYSLTCVCEAYSIVLFLIKIKCIEQYLVLKIFPIDGFGVFLKNKWLTTIIKRVALWKHIQAFREHSKALNEALKKKNARHILIYISQNVTSVNGMSCHCCAKWYLVLLEEESSMWLWNLCRVVCASTVSYALFVEKQWKNGSPAIVTKYWYILLPFCLIFNEKLLLKKMQ